MKTEVYNFNSCTLFYFRIHGYNRRMIASALSSLLIVVLLLGFVYWALEYMPEPFGKIAQVIIIALFIIYILKYFGI